MERITELLIGRLSLDKPGERLAFLVDEINRVIKPPRAATCDNVNIRAMYIINDLINSHGGRFRGEDLAGICEQIRDTPVLVGHNRSDAPLARTFHAELEEKDGVQWVKSYFFWPRVTAGESDDLLLKIDSGVLKECSISFVYGYPECSVCGEDFRRCSHEIDPVPTSDSKPHFIYRDISQILETSLVYKGSVKGTYITDKLTRDNNIVVESSRGAISIPSPKNLSKSDVAIIPLGDESDDFGNLEIPAEFLGMLATRKSRSYLLLRSK